jgi:hypothetical protein
MSRTPEGDRGMGDDHQADQQAPERQPPVHRLFRLVGAFAEAQRRLERPTFRAEEASGSR